MSEYKPGTVAEITMTPVDGPATVYPRCMWDALDEQWVSAESGRLYPDPDLWTISVRPLVVLDLGDDAAEAARQLRQFDRAVGGGYCFDIRDRIADQIEAQTKPPRIPEPGLWGVVEAETCDLGAVRWVRASDHINQPWVCADADATARWDDLIDPTLIREGLS